MSPDTIAIIATVILAAVGVIAVRKSDNAEIHADLRELRSAVAANAVAVAELRGAVKAEIAELRGALMTHINGHSHPPQQPRSPADPNTPTDKSDKNSS